MRRQAAVGWLCLGAIVLIFVTYGAMALGGTESSGTLFAAENQTARTAGILGVLLAMLLIPASVGAERVLRGIALALAAVALAAPAFYVAAQEVEPAVSDTISCGTVSSPQTYSTPLERASCVEALRKQKTLTAIFGFPSAAVAAASVVVLARRTRQDDVQVPLLLERRSGAPSVRGDL